MTTDTKTRVAPKPAAPKPQAPAKANSAKPAATPKRMDSVPETDVMPKSTTKPASGGNSNQADEDTRTKITQAMADLRAKGFTRPSISAVTGLNDSQVWRAQNDRVHTVEVPIIMDFIAKVVAGDVKPPENGLRKPKVADLEAKIAAALGAVAELDPKATVTALRKAVADVKAALEA